MIRHRPAAALMTLCGLGTAVAGWLTWHTAPADIGDAGTLPAAVHRTGTGSPKETSPPVRVRGPAGLDAAVVPVAARRDGTLRLPADLSTGGWWALGARPGAAAGTVLIAGHVDSREDGLGTFAALHDIPLGARVTVTGADGTARPYRVTARRFYRQQRLPADLFARTGPPRLALVTCAAPYDSGAGRYERNLVLYAAPAGPSGGRTPPGP
ncbi:class F sortase [Streptomyces sp. NPDC059785]|uniref:class F sortase n=1 Tax=unclassified Streptomyces TaxID=2593676 RepID=UPI0036646E27